MRQERRSTPVSLCAVTVPTSLLQVTAVTTCGIYPGLSNVSLLSLHTLVMQPRPQLCCVSFTFMCPKELSALALTVTRSRECRS